MKNIHLLIASVLCLGTTSCFDMNQEPQGGDVYGRCFHYSQ